MTTIEVLIYTKHGCHLCDEVKAQLRSLQQSYPFELREQNIVEDAEIYEKFKDDIPVIFINGRKAFKCGINEQEFTRRLELILKYAT